MFYIGGYTQLPPGVKYQCGRGIEVWDDAVSERKDVTGCYNPSYLALSYRKDYLYAVEEGERGAVIRFLVGSDGILTEEDRIAFSGAGSCHLCLSRDESLLFVSNYVSGSLTVISCGQAGLSVVQEIGFQGKGKHPVRQEAPHIHSCWLRNEGRELLTADLGTDRVYRYLITDREEPLTPFEPQPYIAFPEGSGPRHIAVCHRKQRAYVSTELSNQVFLVQFDDENIGSLKAAWQLTGERGDSICTSHLEIWQERKLLYAAVRGTDEIVWYDIDESSGFLEEKGRCHSGGHFPRHFLLDRCKGELLVANQLSGQVCVFKIEDTEDARCGLKRVLSVPGVSCIVCKAPGQEQKSML